MFFHALLDPPLTSFSLSFVFFQCQRTFDTTTNDTGRYTDFEVSLLSNLVKSNNSISDIGMLIQLLTSLVGDLMLRSFARKSPGTDESVSSPAAARRPWDEAGPSQVRQMDR